MWLTRGDACEEITLDSCNQFEIQGDLFSAAVLHDTVVPTPLEDAVNNMRVIEMLKQEALSR